MFTLNLIETLKTLIYNIKHTKNAKSQFRNVITVLSSKTIYSKKRNVMFFVEHHYYQNYFSNIRCLGSLDGIL